MIPETLQQNWEEYKAEAFSDPIDAEEEMFRKAIFFDGALAAANMMLEGNKQNGELGLAKTAMEIAAANQSMSDGAEAIGLISPK
jgi:hypothetical protein